MRSLTASRPERQLPQGLPFRTDLSDDLRPANLVEGRRGAEVLERNGLQWIDAVEKEYSDGGKITGDVGNPLEKLEADPLISGGHYLPNECARDIHGKQRLGDSRIG